MRITFCVQVAPGKFQSGRAGQVEDEEEEGEDYEHGSLAATTKGSKSLSAAHYI
jgi:hypothetical protein